MSVPVEAQSLSALTNLFANPPQYPRNPTHEILEPLTLYIVRVPGSKDVFLSPLKPPTKASISLEAIQSSLYYLHVVTDEDEEIKRILDEQQRSEELKGLTPPIHRKPLPSVPYVNYLPSQRPIPPPKSYPSYQPGIDGNTSASHSERYAARGTRLRFSTEIEGPNTPVPRAPPSPRKYQSQIDSTNRNSFTSIGALSIASDQSIPSRQGWHNLRRNNSHEAPLPPHEHRDNTSAAIQASDMRLPSTPCDPSSRTATNQPSIILIRRDPVSGSQWNVGSIRLNNDPILNMSLDPFSIEINTPGYHRFATAPEFSSSRASLSDANSIKEALANGILWSQTCQEGLASSESFTRTVNYIQQVVEKRPFRIHHRTNSSDAYTKPPSPTKQMRQVYSFTSPWHGVCYFANGIDGKSLKCRHTLASSVLAEDELTTNVAELRFNLPWSITTSRLDKEAEDRTLPISKLVQQRSSGGETIRKGLRHFKTLSRGNFPPGDQQIIQELANQSTADSDRDRISLKLGREKAGGGFKGTSAKLGKLIIEDEGLKMCDLVVAACMGVWWQHYEKRND